MEERRKGYYRLYDVLKLIPVKKSTWYAGVKTGRFPAPLKMGRMSFWKVEDIERLMDEMESARSAV